MTETFTGNLVLKICNLDVCMWASEAGFILQVVKRKRNMACDETDMLSKRLLFATVFENKVKWVADMAAFQLIQKSIVLVLSS